MRRISSRDYMTLMETGDVDRTALYYVTPKEITLISWCENDEHGGVRVASADFDFFAAHPFNFEHDELWDVTCEIPGYYPGGITYEENMGLDEAALYFLNGRISEPAVFFTATFKTKIEELIRSMNGSEGYAFVYFKKPSDNIRKMRFTGEIAIPNDVKTFSEKKTFVQENMERTKLIDISCTEDYGIFREKRLSPSFLSYEISESTGTPETEDELDYDIWNLFTKYAKIGGITFKTEEIDFAITKELGNVMIRMIENMSGQQVIKY